VNPVAVKKSCFILYCFVSLAGNLKEHKRKEDGEMRLQESPVSSLFYPADGCSKFLHSIGSYVSTYTVSHSIRL
jgi:hypothetical protein